MSSPSMTATMQTENSNNEKRQVLSSSGWATVYPQ